MTNLSKVSVFILTLLALEMLPMSAVMAQSGSCSSANVKCVPSEYSTIQACANVAVAGDTCLVSSGGTYNERITPANSGTAGSPVTFLVESGTKSKVRGFTISSKNYITVDGFEITHQGMTAGTNDTGITISGTNTGIKILNNNIHHINSTGIQFGSSSFLTIRGNDISYAGIDDTPMYGSAIYSAFRAPSTDVLVENNNISFVADYFNPAGSRFVYRNNIIGPADPATGHHIDGWQNNALLEYMLVEGNLSRDNKSSDNHFFLTSAQANYVIARYNSTFNTKGGMEWGEGGQSNVGWSFYNNTFYENQTCCNVGNTQVGSNNATDPMARNNIWYKSTAPNGNPYNIGGITDKDYDLCFMTGNCNESNDVTSDPNFVNGASGNFNLQSSSPAINAGGPLTTVAVSDSGSGTSLVVTKAYLFQDGWAGVDKDWIAVGSVSNIVQISSINYSSNTITLASGVSRNDGDSVWLYKKSDGVQVLFGSAPDIGAFENGSVATSPTPPPPPVPNPIPNPTPTPVPPPNPSPAPVPPAPIPNPDLNTPPIASVPPVTPTTNKRVYNLGTATLRNGSRGEAVKELQRFLNDKLNLGLVLDGKLGPKTIAVMKKWQRDNGLVADGLIGPKTKIKINSEK